MSNILEIRDDLWECIKDKYNDKHFTNVILDSINFMGGKVQDMSNSTLDGVKLATEAFSVNNPKIKMKDNNPKTERSLQQGMMDTVKGVYELIRNKRSHEIAIDSKQDADAIVKFIDFLLRQLDTANTEFTIEHFAERVFEENFSPIRRYSELMYDKIPRKRLLDTLIYITNRLMDTSYYGRYKELFDILITNLSKEERAEYMGIISAKFEILDSFSQISHLISVIPFGNWLDIDEISRIRIERLLLREIVNYKPGFHSEDDLEFNLFVRLKPLLKFFHNESDYRSLLIEWLSSKNSACVYCIVSNYWDYLSVTNPDGSLPEDFVGAVLKALRNRMNLVFSKLKKMIDEREENVWYLKFSVSMHNYTNLTPQSINGFQVIDSDDDIPF